MCDFCNACLISAKADCRKKKIHIGKLATLRHKSGNNLLYEVWQDSQNQGWISAHCAADAKFKFLVGQLEKWYARQVCTCDNPKLRCSLHDTSFEDGEI